MSTQNNLITRAVRLALTASAATALLSASVYAAEEDVEVEADDGERIIVTGSRIPRKELSSPSPVVVIDSEELKRFGTNDFGSMLTEFAAVASTDSLQGNSGSNQQAGVSSPNLRNLGANRTLVLVNGKRHVASTQGSAQVDLNTIPVSLIEKVEVITGGASAIYGSDAVTGVINVIMREDFEGFEFNLNGVQSTEGVGAANTSMNILAGTNFGEGRGNITVFAGRDYTEETMSADIRQLNSFGSISNQTPGLGTEEDGIPDRVTVPFVGSEMINAFGVINPFGANATRYTFMPDGTPILQATRDRTNSFAFGNFPGGCDTCFFGEQYENIFPAVKKINVGSTVNYEFTDNLEFYGEFKFIQSDIEQQFQPSFRFGNISINVTDNPFLDVGLRQTLLDLGMPNVSMAKFFDELGNRSADNRRETLRVVGGLRGDFDIGNTVFDFDLYYVNGTTNNSRQTLNSLVPDNLVAALDAVIDPATGEAACRSQVPSAQGAGYVDPAAINGDQCVPYNIFGFGSASAAARDFVSADVLRQDEIGQELYGGSVVFDTGEFANIAGPIGIALGFEYREEFSETLTDELTKSGILANAATPDENGGYDVTESYIELSLPLLSDLPGAEELTLDLAYRTADYSHAGNANAWKVGLVYAPIEDLRIRTTIGTSVRAPNISEAFSPQSPGFGRVSDPCDDDNIGDVTARTANCAALGIPVGFQANDNASINLISGGNPDLTSEESESTTIGIVWSPSFIEDFSITVDVYKIEIADAILFIDTQTIADNCVDAAAGLDADFCGQIDRDPVTHDISLIRSGFVNASAISVEGIEADFRYAVDLSEFSSDLPGRLSAHLFVGQLRVLEEFQFQNQPEEVNDEVGEVGDPEWQSRLTINYVLDDLSVNWTSRFVDRSARFEVTPGKDIPEDISPSFIGSITTHDLSASYNVTDDINVYAGIRNISDKLPPGYTIDPIYDAIGRRFFAGATFRF